MEPTGEHEPTKALADDEADIVRASAWLGATLAMLMKAGISPNLIAPHFEQTMLARYSRFSGSPLAGVIGQEVMKLALDGATEGVKYCDELKRKIGWNRS